MHDTAHKRNCVLPVGDKVTVPVGECPVTVAVHELVEPTTMTEGLQLTDAVVEDGLSVTTEIVFDPELAT